MRKLAMTLLLLVGILLLVSCGVNKYFDRATVANIDVKVVTQKERYAPVPIEMFLLREDEYEKFNKYANNYYFCYGLVPEWTDATDTYEYMDFFLMTDHEDNVEYLSVAVIGNDKQKGWTDLEGEFEVYVYFKFAGYSHELQRPVGYYQFYEPIYR